MGRLDWQPLMFALLECFSYFKTELGILVTYNCLEMTFNVLLISNP
jgi:hypothetical protein